MPFVRVPLFTVLLLTGLSGSHSVAAATPEKARVVSVLDGDTLVVDPSAGGRQEVRLMGVQAPKPYPDGSEDWLVKYADAARRVLDQLVGGTEVTLILPEPRTNRYGQWLAQVHRADGLWVQGEMLHRGLVRVQTTPSTSAEAAEMLVIEAQARTAGRGLWADRRFAVRTPETVAHDIGTFQLVEGTVRDTARVKSRVFLNFGDNWRTDFTVSLPSRLAASFARDGFDVMALTGQLVRVRGWIDEYNGPLIELTHREQIEVVSGETAASDAIEPPTPTPPAATRARVGAPAEP